MQSRDTDRDGILPDDSSRADDKRPSAERSTRTLPRADKRRQRLGGRPPWRGPVGVACRVRRRVMTRDLIIIGALASVVALAFYGARRAATWF
jgi:hypothetical protein